MAMKIDKDTQLCLSISSRPGNFGTTIHNAAYEACNLNYIYKAFGITDIENAVKGIRAFNIRGCGVSMPYKESIIPFLDEIDHDASQIGAINTVVNNHGILKGYNTDIYGIEIALSKLKLTKTTTVLLIGAGGMAKAIVSVLKKMNLHNILVSNRTPKKAISIAQQFSIEALGFSEVNETTVDFLINATSVGMAPDLENCVFSLDQIRKSKFVLDVPTNPIETKLIRLADSCGKQIIPGHLISLHQAARQFELYTKTRAPLEAMKSAMLTLLS